MLSSLHIKDFAIIDELEVNFNSGLNVMTGETGAGKTIVVEALNLILGERAQGDTVRSGKEKASVTAVFRVKDARAGLKEYLDGANIEWSDEIIVHRVVAEGGKGKVAVNGVPVTAGWLKNLGQMLVDVSSQHEHQILLDVLRHAEIVDAYGSLEKEFASYKDAHGKYFAAMKELHELEANEKTAKDKLDFLKFQLQELENANLKAGEEEEIESQRSRLKNAKVLEEHARFAEEALYGGEGSAMELIGRAASQVAQCGQFDSKARIWSDALSRARAEVEDVARDLARYVENLDSNPARLEEVDERLHVIRQLVRKHGGSIESCMRRRDEIRAELDTIENYDDILAEKRSIAEALGGQRKTAARNLSAARRSVSGKLGGRIEAELKTLGMGKTKFSVIVEAKPEAEWDESGPDRVEFVISPNVGEPLRALHRIASGGELSRVMLAVKCALAGRASLASTSVFDEVDSGIGGAVAEAVGKKLKEAAKARQVICITHLPQVAVHGDCHLKISKRVNGGRTVATLETVSESGRADEIARMLGGEKITAATLAHAKEMLVTANSKF